MCDGGRGRLWRALLIASRVQLETRRTYLSPALGAAYRRWVYSSDLTTIDPNRRGRKVWISPQLTAAHLSLLAHCLIWMCRIVENAVKAQLLFFLLLFVCIFWRLFCSANNVCRSKHNDSMSTFTCVCVSREKTFFFLRNKARTAVFYICGMRVCVV